MFHFSNAQSHSIHRYWIVLGLSGFIGFIIGIVGNPTWHHAAEGAQALSGVVAYPSPTPFYIYQIKAWTLLHQIPAIFLHFNLLTEIQISYLLSGFAGSLSFMALSLCAFAFTGEIIFAIAIPFLITYTRLISYGPCYPVVLVGITASYGVFGQSWMLLTLSLISLHRYRLGGLLLGLYPAIHPGMAFLTYGIVAIALFLWGKDVWFKMIRSFMAGLMISAISFGVQLWIIQAHQFPEFPRVSSDLFYNYIRNWDSHRMPIPWHDTGIWINLLASVIGFLAIYRHGNEIPKNSKLLLGFSILAGCFGLLAVGLSHVPLGQVPFFLVQLMPGRILNFNILLFFIMVIGLLKTRKGFLTQGLVLIALVYLPVLAKFESEFTDHALHFIGMSLIIILLHQWKVQPHVTKPQWIIHKLFWGIQTLVLCFLMVRLSWKDFQNAPEMQNAFIDWSNDKFLAKVKDGKGLLLLGPDLSAAQLITRRPILIDGGALDIISYFPELAMPAANILNDIYEINLFNPPLLEDPVAVLPQDLNKSLWEQRSLEEWQRLKDKYGFTQILTSRWNLQLPKVAEDENYILNSISS